MTTRTEVIETELLDELVQAAAEALRPEKHRRYGWVPDLHSALGAVLAARSDRRLAEARARVVDLPIEE